MGQTIISGNKLSPVAMHQINTMVFIEMLESNTKYLIQNFNLPTIKWDGGE